MIKVFMFCGIFLCLLSCWSQDTNENLQKAAIAYIPIEYEILKDEYAESKTSIKSDVKIFNVLMALFLSKDEKNIMLERERLDMIVQEYNISKDINDQSLLSADIIVRGRIHSQSGTDTVLEFQMTQKNNTENKESFQLSLQSGNPFKSAREASKKVFEFAGKPCETEPDIMKEAEYYHEKASVYSANKKYLTALQYYKMASLLNGGNNEFARDYHTSIFAYLLAHIKLWNFVGPNWFPECTLTKAEYMEMVSALSESLDRASSETYPYKNVFIRELRPYGFLTVAKDAAKFKFTEKEWADITVLRKKLKAFFEAFFKNRECNDDYKLTLCSPLFFTSPEPCFEYIKPLLLKDNTPWSKLRNDYFSGLKHWRNTLLKPQEKEAIWRKKWIDLLEQIKDKKSKYIQFNTRIALCFMEKSLIQDAKDKVINTKNLHELINWMQKTDNLNWLSEDRWRCYDIFDLISRNGFPLLTFEEQNIIYEKIFLPILRTPQVKEENIGTYLVIAASYFNSRFELNVTAGKKPDDKIKMNELLNKTLQIARTLNQSNYELLTKCITESKWYGLLNNIKKNEQDYPFVKNGRLLFDYQKEFPDCFTSAQEPSFAGNDATVYYDSPFIWFAWPVGNGLGIARIDLKTGKYELFNICKDRRSVSHMTVYKNFLCLACFSYIAIVPISKNSPYLDVSAVRTLGPKLGTSELGLPFPDYNFKKVTALIAGEEYLYICLRGLGTSDIYKWKTGMQDGEMLSSSESLNDSALSDCKAYQVLAGFYDKKIKKEIFFITGKTTSDRKKTDEKNSNKKEIRGVWSHDPVSNEWAQISDYDFDPFVRMVYPPVFFSENVFSFSLGRGMYFYYNIKDSTVEKSTAMNSMCGNFSWASSSSLNKLTNKKDCGDAYLKFEQGSFEVSYIIPTEFGLVVIFRQKRDHSTKAGIVYRRALVYLIDENK